MNATNIENKGKKVYLLEQYSKALGTNVDTDGWWIAGATFSSKTAENWKNKKEAGFLFRVEGYTHLVD
jgi:hypothetical protein